MGGSQPTPVVVVTVTGGRVDPTVDVLETCCDEDQAIVKAAMKVLVDKA